MQANPTRLLTRSCAEERGKRASYLVGLVFNGYHLEIVVIHSLECRNGQKKFKRPDHRGTAGHLGCSRGYNFNLYKVSSNGVGVCMIIIIIIIIVVIIIIILNMDHLNHLNHMGHRTGHLDHQEYLDHLDPSGPTGLPGPPGPPKPPGSPVPPQSPESLFDYETPFCRNILPFLLTARQGRKLTHYSRKQLTTFNSETMTISCCG